MCERACRFTAMSAHISIASTSQKAEQISMILHSCSAENQNVRISWLLIFVYLSCCQANLKVYNVILLTPPPVVLHYDLTTSLQRTGTQNSIDISLPWSNNFIYAQVRGGTCVLKHKICHSKCFAESHLNFRYIWFLLSIIWLVISHSVQFVFKCILYCLTTNQMPKDNALPLTWSYSILHTYLFICLWDIFLVYFLLVNQSFL